MQVQLQKEELAQLQQSNALRNQIYQQIAPFANLLMQMGIDPIKFLQTPQGAAMLAPIREEISNNFEQARMNAVDMFAGTGFSPGSGLAAGPLASLYGQEVGAQAGALQNLFGNAINMGLQGANVLQGQQAIFNPSIAGGLANQAANTVITAPATGLRAIAPALIGAAGTALGGYLGRPTSTPTGTGSGR
jgi:hypothetical protein